VYPLSELSDGPIRKLILMNPVTPPVEMFRYAVLGVGTIEPVAMTASLVFTTVILFIGIIVFNRVERTFMDTV
jgi:lipopolysaccharide transport system permease protein